MFQNFTLQSETPDVKIYGYEIECLYTVDCLRYQIFDYSNGTFMFVKYRNSNPVKTVSGYDLTKFEPHKYF
jgi:hypothetical protein